MGNKPQSRALTCAFLRPGTPTPAERPLPHAPVGHPAVVLPVDGLNVLFGRSAPRVVSLALRRALQQGYRPVAVGLEFNHKKKQLSKPPSLYVLQRQVFTKIICK